MKSTFALAICIVLLVCTACNKNGNDTPVPRVDTAISEHKADVYLAGYVTLPGYRSPVGVYWKNDSLVQLTNDSNGYSFAASVTLYGNDVYVGGGNLNRAVYWKNGIPISLPCNLYSYINALEIHGSDIYAAGVNGLKAGFWKNGTAIQLSADSIDAGSVSDMAISGSDVYLAGYEYKFSNTHVATLWHNGIPEHLTNGKYYSEAAGVSIAGTDVYVCGTEVDSTGNYFIAEYWKNGQLIRLTDGTSSYLCSDIVIQGNDVYIVGSTREGKISDQNQTAHGVLWKNNVLQDIGITNTTGYLTKITTNGSDLYMLFDEYNGSNTSVSYFKNNTKVSLTTPQAYASGIYVADK